MRKNTLGPGFLFRPTDTDLVSYYLRRKLLGDKSGSEAITELYIYKFAPWDLPFKSGMNDGDPKWYFFCPVEKKYASRVRFIRVTEYGYLKVSGRDIAIYHKRKVVGMKKTLVSHQGKGSKGDQTNWIMHEYRMADKDLDDKGIVQDASVLCVVFQKDGLGGQYEVPLHNPALAFATDPFAPQSHCLGSSVCSSYADSWYVILHEMVTMESRQLSDYCFQSVLAMFIEECSEDSSEMEDDFSLLFKASDFIEAPENLLLDEADDLLSFLADFIDDINPIMEAPQESMEMEDVPPGIAYISDSN